MTRTWNSGIAITGLFTLLTSGCFGVGDIDRTQPEKVRKCIFFEEPCADLTQERGDDFVPYTERTPAEYYFRPTVIDIASTSGLSFIGEQGNNELVVWDIQRDFLFAYRAYPWLEDSRTNTADGYVRPDTGAYQGSPVAAFRIVSHFDVQRQYNARTGEQMNVITENMMDRHWYDRDYIRVDWSNNLISDFQFGAAAVQQAPVGMYIQAEGDMPQSQGNLDAAVISRDYIDIVQRMTAQPEVNQLYTNYFGFPILECWLYSSIMNDCMGVNLKVRNSFMRKTDRKYTALEYDDMRFNKFGYFRTERYTYDPDYGYVDSGASRLVNRWNIWGDSSECYDATALRPYATCKKGDLKPIVYYLNADFPNEYKEVAESNAQEWNALFTETVLAGTGWDASEMEDKDMFIICPNNPVKAGDPVECGETGLNPQIGDLRYSMYYYVPNEHASSPLGYGPSAADPLTGEIIQGNAFYYGAPGRWIARRTLDIYKYEKGLISAEDIGAGVPARAAISATINQESSRIASRGRFMKERVLESIDKLGILERADILREKVRTGEAYHDMGEANLAKLQDTALNEYAVTEEIRQAFGPEFMGPDGDYVQAEGITMDKLLSKDLFDYRDMRQERLLSPKAGGCILMADDKFDVGYSGLFYQIESRFGTGQQFLDNEEEAFTWLVARTMGDTQLHEIGHTVGLRHNFAASTDPVNFEEGFWTLKGFLLKDDTRPKPEWEYDNTDLVQFDTILNGGIEDRGLRDYQFSSVMDYQSVYGVNTRLGMYDQAAVTYAYADMVELFDTDEAGVDVTAERADLLKRGTMHYTFYPEAISNAGTYAERVASIYKRKYKNYRLVDEATDVEVPYAFCSDEYRGGSEVCNLWDMGLDNYERAWKKAADYRNYYIYNAFKRERVGFGVSPFDYIARVYNRSFVPLLDQYKNWVNEELIIRRDDTCYWYEGGQLQSDPDRFTADACGLHGYVAATEVMNLLAEVIQAPALGCYSRLETGCYEIDGNTGRNPLDDLEMVKISDDPEACDTHVIAPNEDGEIERITRKVYGNDPYHHIDDSTTCAGWTGIADRDSGEIITMEALEFGIEDGARPERTTYDRDVFGYYFYWKPTAMGYWWDKWMAIKALSDPYTDFIGVDSSSDQASYAISLATLFAEDINNLVGGMIIERPDRYAGRIGNDGSTYEPLKAIGLYTSDTIDRDTATQPWVDPDQQYTLQLIAMMNVAYQAWNIDDFDFANSMRVETTYDIDEVVSAELQADSERFVQMTEPSTGQVFFAVRSLRYLDQAQEKPYLSVAYQYIRDVKDQFFVGGAEGPGTELIEGIPAWRIEQETRMMRIMAASSGVFGGASVWSGDVQF